MAVDPQTQRKLLEILRILSESKEVMGARRIASELNRRGYRIGERAVRYHLRILDERGFTKKHGYIGRTITENGLREIGDALVGDRMGLVITKIEDLVYRTTFDPKTKKGEVIVNTAFIDKDKFEPTIRIINAVLERGYGVSPYIKILEEGEHFNDIIIPRGKVGVATVCSITIDGILLKSGIPVETKYGGLIEIKEAQPVHFSELIAYAGTSIEPIQIFISKRLTSITNAIAAGSGMVLGNVREIPAVALARAKEVLDAIKHSGINGLIAIGEAGKAVLDAPVEAGRVGIAVYSGVNAMAAVEEQGIATNTRAISTLIPFKDMSLLS
ncbi:MAG: NrpR regulatory domain-containing protein [Methanocellales archaeon]